MTTQMNTFAIQLQTMTSTLQDYHTESVNDAVRRLAEKYGFDSREASDFIHGIDEVRKAEIEPTKEKAAPKPKKEKAAPKPKKEKTAPKPKKEKAEPTVLLPFCGDILPQNCSAICLNHGLHTQCARPWLENTGGYCKSHTQEERRPYGDIQDRLATYNEVGRWGLEFRDKKGVKTKPYSSVMTKLKITREQAEAEANKQEVNIPEEHFNVVEKKSGRPAKPTAAVSDSESEQKPKKRVGRPKKSKPVVESKHGDDLIAALVAETEKPTIVDLAVGVFPEKDDEEVQPTTPPAPLTSEEKSEMINDSYLSDDDEESLHVAPFEHEGIHYYKSENGTLYDIDTEEPVGVWDEIENKITKIDANDDDE